MYRLISAIIAISVISCGSEMESKSSLTEIDPNTLPSYSCHFFRDNIIDFDAFQPHDSSIAVSIAVGSNSCRFDPYYAPTRLLIRDRIGAYECWDAFGHDEAMVFTDLETKRIRSNSYTFGYVKELDKVTPDDQTRDCFYVAHDKEREDATTETSELLRDLQKYREGGRSTFQRLGFYRSKAEPKINGCYRLRKVVERTETHFIGPECELKTKSRI